MKKINLVARSSSLKSNSSGNLKKFKKVNQSNSKANQFETNNQLINQY